MDSGLLCIDLIGEDSHILLTIRAHLRTNFPPNLPHQSGNKVLMSASSVQIDCYANAKVNALNWLRNAPSLAASSRSLFLICPSETSKDDEPAMGIWRNSIEESEVIRRTANKNPSQEQSLQIIRGFWEDPNAQKTSLTPNLLNNVSYAFANITKHLRSNSPQPEEEINSFREMPQTLSNYGCEKCSDPECEHKLFGFLKNQQ